MVMTIKRLNYFTGQFLEEKDFREEQQYHIDSLRLHNENLHTWGIAKGLDITSSDDKKHLKISKGMAIDKNGRQIILSEDIETDVNNFSEPGFYLVVSFHEDKTDDDELTGEKNQTRWEEEPQFDQENSKPDDTSTKIILAKVIMNSETEIIEEIDINDRKYAGVGQEQIVDKSIPISKMKSNSRGGGPLRINAMDKERADIITITPHQDPSKTHRFFITSVIPTSQDSIIKWWWQVENNENQINHILWVENLSDKTIEYYFKIYEISEI
jgi:hypothetical protein